MPGITVGRHPFLYNRWLEKCRGAAWHLVWLLFFFFIWEGSREYVNKRVRAGSSRRTPTQVCEQWAEQWRKDVAEMIDSELHSWRGWMAEVSRGGMGWGKLVVWRWRAFFSWGDSVSPIFSIKCKLGYTGISQLVHSSDRKFYRGATARAVALGPKERKVEEKQVPFMAASIRGRWDDKGSSDRLRTRCPCPRWLTCGGGLREVPGKQEPIIWESWGMLNLSLQKN